EYANEIKERLKSFLKPEQIIPIELDIHDFNGIMSELCALIKKEKSQKSNVFINISSGGKLFASAATIACMMYDATPYYVVPEEYKIHGEDFYENGKTLGLSSGMKDIIDIPKYTITPPPKEFIQVLKILQNGSMKQKDIIKELNNSGVMQKVYDAKNKNKILKKAYMEFRRNYLQPLLDKGLIKKEGQSRKQKITITEEGLNTLNIFGKVYSIP
ncbi:MAG: DUF6293 family protein, partial [Methanosarcinales archaeon]